MAAFVPASSFLSSRITHSQGSRCRLPLSSRPRTPRSRRNLIMNTAPEDTSKQPNPDSSSAPAEPEIPKEPYSGYFADMKRMGLSEEEAYAQARKAQKQSNPVKSGKVGGAKNLFKPDGTPYAPWMAVSAEYDPSIIKKRTDATGKLAADPQSGELSGAGLSWKMLGDELELRWATGSEEGNRGFVVYRRAGKSNSWEKLSDYRDKPAELSSKGPGGGKYSFLVSGVQPGTWVYRVSDVDENNNVSDLSQVLVEIESAEDTRIQKIALAALLAILALAAFVGLSLDPLSTT
ncbi:unnamed protein product [Agarophyton chilense]|eukprot:gb/GEZJ01000785.1/.p1 GENE.gb/GEZJ01000785.1/~~gb/GEZJ01000785.1/.p1  ORF type:complete len:291 (-),score=38.37 gb/GEZJ01000785.1/:1130-2002(-)